MVLGRRGRARCHAAQGSSPPSPSRLPPPQIHTQTFPGGGWVVSVGGGKGPALGQGSRRLRCLAQGLTSGSKVGREDGKFGCCPGLGTSWPGHVLFLARLHFPSKLSSYYSNNKRRISSRVPPLPSVKLITIPGIAGLLFLPPRESFPFPFFFFF